MLICADVSAWWFKEELVTPSIASSPRFCRFRLSQNSLSCFSEWSLSVIFWAIRGALPPARLLMIRLTWILHPLELWVSIGPVFGNQQG